MVEIEVYQFLSRKNIENVSLGQENTSPKQRPNMNFNFDFRTIDKPFEINFTQIIPEHPCIGAHEYIDSYVDIYMQKRWPKCIQGRAEVNMTNEELRNNEILKQVLHYTRLIIWNLKAHNEKLARLTDQYATVKAYRREYFNHQIGDICGNRRPSSRENFCLTEIGEYIGPGVATILNQNSLEHINEFVWSQIIPIPNPTNLTDDLPRIRQQLIEIRKHYNSYNELVDAQQLLSSRQLKSSVRAAASAVDAILRYYCALWDVSFPGNLQFDQKIDSVLIDAGKPVYSTADPLNSEKLLYLYRARNSMHEGDCYYKNRAGKVIKVNAENQVEEFIDAAEQFTLWIDSVA